VLAVLSVKDLDAQKVASSVKFVYIGKDFEQLEITTNQ
jgi:hypothetical protein